MKFSTNNIIQIALLILLSYPIIFTKLDGFSIRYWDESMFADNAYEMSHNGDYIVPHHEGIPDMYNSKPPLLIWAQVFFINIIGFNEYAIRLPSAIGTMLTIILMFVFLKKYFNSWLAWICSLILLTSHGFITFHSGRTGDADALLTLFLTISNISFVLLIFGNKKSNILLLLFFASLSLAFLTKSFASVLFGLGYIFVLLLNKNIFVSLLKNKFTWIGLFLFLCISVFYCLVRDYKQEGYINYLFNHDAGRVYSEIEKHKEPFDFYLWNIAENYYAMWFMILISGFVLILAKTSEEKIRKLVIVSSLLLGYFIIISVSATKLCWYDMPLYPLMSIIAGYPIYKLFSFLAQTNFKYGIIALVFLFAIPYRQAVGFSQSNTFSAFEEKNEVSEKYIHQAIRSGINLDNYYVFHEGYDRSLLFYKYFLKEQNKKLNISSIPDFPVNARVIVSNDSLKQILTHKYSTISIEKYHNATVYEIQKIL